MATSYPGGLDEFDPLTPGPSGSKQSQIIGGRSHAEHHNDLGDAVEAIQAELGTDPAGSSDTVKARIAAAETAISGKANTSHTHAEGDVTGLTAALAGKANSSHTHSQSDVTGLTAALAEVDTRGPMPAVGEWLANGVWSTASHANSTAGLAIFAYSEIDQSFMVDQAMVYQVAGTGVFQIGIHEPGINGALIGSFESHSNTGAGYRTMNAVAPFMLPKQFCVQYLLLSGSCTLAGARPQVRPGASGSNSLADSYRSGLAALSSTGMSTFAGSLAQRLPLISFRRSA